MQVRQLEARCEGSEAVSAEVAALGREVDELRVRVTVEQQMRQQTAATAAAATAAAAAAGSGSPLSPLAVQQWAAPQPVGPGALTAPLPLPARSMSHREIRHHLRRYKHAKEAQQAQPPQPQPAATPQPEPEPEPEP